MTVRLAYNELAQFSDGNGAPYAGAQLFTYSAGTSTKLDTFKTIAGSTANSNPIVLDANGRIPFAIWLTVGMPYKFVLAPANDTDPPVSPIWSLDNITGINDPTIVADEWIAGSTPTYISATQFSVADDQTDIFITGRRVKIVDSGGTEYATVVTSAYSTITTVTVAVDASGSLDSGLSAVSYALQTPNSDPAGSHYGSIQFNDVFNAKIPVYTNCRIVASVGSSALTIAVKGNDGNDPSATNPVWVPFRSATAGNDSMEWLKITSATSFVVSSTSTLGTVSGVLSQLGVVAFNDAGTFRLGAVNVSNYKLENFVITSSTAEGGAGGADSAGVIYTGTAVSSKAMTILGLVESTQVTAGTWATAPSKIQLGADWIGTITLASPQASTSGTSIDFTGIPAGTKRITVNFVGVSTNGTSDIIIQIGDSGGIEDSGYLGSAGQSGTFANYTNGFGLVNGPGAGSIHHGSMTLSLENYGTNTWCSIGIVSLSNAATVYVSGGSKSLSGVLDRVRVTMANGTDAFDAGEVNLMHSS